MELNQPTTTSAFRTDILIAGAVLNAFKIKTEIVKAKLQATEKKQMEVRKLKEVCEEQLGKVVKH